MPSLASPEWLVPFAALVLLALRWRRPRIQRPLRALALVLLGLSLAGLRLGGTRDGLDLWVLSDHSASARELLVPRMREIEGLLEDARPLDGRLFFVDFAEQARLRGDSESESLEGLGEETRLASALGFALSSMDSGRSARVLLVTDGYPTEPLEGIAERLERQEVALDLRFVSPPSRRDVRIETIELPARGRPGEPFTVEVRFRGHEDGEARFVLLRNGRLRAQEAVALRDGFGVARFADRLPAGGGAMRYEARLVGGDDVPGNDRASAWIEIEGGPRLLLVTAYSDDPLAAVLSAKGIPVEVVTEPSRLTPGDLAGARAVVLNNVPATRVPSELLASLDSWVRVQGGGLLMAGGQGSFGSGGYFRSSLDALLPVSMELREEHRMLSVAMAIVMDRSGSMAAGVAEGRTKMDLANEGAARSIELLGPSDSVAVFAVDSQAHTVVPLTSLGDGPKAIVDKVRRVESMGGGIFVYEGLSAAWKTLRSSVAGQRHVILFADAADSEEPGDYRRLLDEMAAEGATVSVIGFGSAEDADAPLLQDIARRGKGRVFFHSDPETLPALFAQETVAVARSAFIEDPVAVRPAAGWLEIASAPIQGLDLVDGYNLSYLREDATAGAYSGDEYEAPLVASWNRGAGRVAAVSFPLGGPFSARARAWPGYGDFAQTLARWLMGEDVPPGIGLSTRVEGSIVRCDLWFDTAWEERLSKSPPELLLVSGGGSDVETLVWERLEPGRFRAQHPLRSGEIYRGAVRAGASVLPFGPITAPGSAEWSFDRARLEELQAVSRASGGVERTVLASAWEDGRAATERSTVDLRPALLWCFLFVFVVEALVSRIGWRLPEIDFRRLAAPSPRDTAAPPEVREAPYVPKEVDHVTVPAASERRRTRFARAKDGR
jgi:von Willebrand factor type A domain